jgi:hypothetical protein
MRLLKRSGQSKPGSKGATGFGKDSVDREHPSLGKLNSDQFVINPVGSEGEPIGYNRERSKYLLVSVIQRRLSGNMDSFTMGYDPKSLNTLT